MERKLRFVWWGVLVILIIVAIWKLFLPHGSKAYIDKASADREIVVYVTGAVETSKLVHLPVDARIDDALKQVRVLPEANLDALNPAEKLKDGQKITVPLRQSQNGLGTSGTGSAATPAASSSNGQAGAQALAVNDPAPNGAAKININQAGTAELDKIPGIGPALAERIIQYRTEHGPFARPEDLQKVSGIGSKTYEKMAPYVTAGP